MQEREPYCLGLAAWYDQVTDINTCLKFCLLFWWQDDVEGKDKICLCSKCGSFLVHEGAATQDMRSVWPAFVWGVLRDDMIASHCGIEVAGVICSNEMVTLVD